MYLIYAECNLRGGGGDAATALSYLNKIRTRAYGNTGSGTISEFDLQTVLDERGRNYIGKGIVVQTFIRYGLPYLKYLFVAMEGWCWLRNRCRFEIQYFPYSGNKPYF